MNKNNQFLFDIPRTAQLLGISTAALLKFLNETDIMTTQFDSENMPGIEYCREGYFIVELGMNGQNEALVTDKGLQWLANLLP